MNKIYGIPDKDYFFDNWIFILLCLYFIFPVGFLLLFRKINLHRRNLFTSGKIAIGIAIFIFCFGLIIFISIISIEEIYIEDINLLYNFVKFIWTISLAVFGVGLLTRITSKKYQKYINLVVNEKIIDLNEIASRMKLSRNNVIKDLDRLINKRYLEDYVIEPNNNIIYHLKEKLEEEAFEQQRIKEKKMYTRVINCRNCGANNLIEEKIGKCRYCNSYIE